MNEDTDRAALGARLKNAREYQGFSQEDVAKHLGVPRSAISLIETGARGLDILELKKLATLYDCSIEDLTAEHPGQSAEPDSIFLFWEQSARGAGQVAGWIVGEGENLDTVSEQVFWNWRIKMVAHAAAALSPEDRSEILRFAQFLRTRKSGKQG